MYVAPFQLALRQGTELFPNTTQIPPVVRTEMFADLSGVEDQMGALLGAAQQILQQEPREPLPVPGQQGIETQETLDIIPDATDADRLTFAPLSAEFTLTAATHLADAAMQTGSAAAGDAAASAADQVARHAPAIRQFIQGQRQLQQSGISPSQRTYLDMPGINMRYTSLQGQETIDLKVAVPQLRNPTRPPDITHVDLSATEALQRIGIAVLFFDGDL